MYIYWISESIKRFWIALIKLKFLVYGSMERNSARNIEIWLWKRLKQIFNLMIMISTMILTVKFITFLVHLYSMVYMYLECYPMDQLKRYLISFLYILGFWFYCEDDENFLKTKITAVAKPFKFYVYIETLNSNKIIEPKWIINCSQWL